MPLQRADPSHDLEWVFARGRETEREREREYVKKTDNGFLSDLYIFRASSRRVQCRLGTPRPLHYLGIPWHCGMVLYSNPRRKLGEYAEQVNNRKLCSYGSLTRNETPGRDRSPSSLPFPLSTSLSLPTLQIPSCGKKLQPGTRSSFLFPCRPPRPSTVFAVVQSFLNHPTNCFHSFVRPLMGV